MSTGNGAVSDLNSCDFESGGRVRCNLGNKSRLLQRESVGNNHQRRSSSAINNNNNNYNHNNGGFLHRNSLFSTAACPVPPKAASKNLRYPSSKYNLIFCCIPSRNMSNEVEVFKGQVTVYSIIGCPHCLRAKNKLADLGLPYSDISLDSFPQCRDDLKKRTNGKTTVPQIFFNEIYIGGNEEFQKLTKDRKKLKEMSDMIRNVPAPKEAPTIPDPSTAVDFGVNEEFVCEPDEYAKLTRDLKKSGIIKDHRAGLLKTHKNSFKGQDLLDWLVKEKGLDMSRAQEMAEELCLRNFGNNLSKCAETFCPDSYYRLIEDDENQALNAGMISECKPIAAIDLGEQLRRLILSVYSEGLSKDGRTVDYKSIEKSNQWEKYKILTRELQRVSVTNLTREEKLAFFINIYNALVIHATIVKGKPNNMWQRYKFFNTSSYIIGGHLYSLQDVENGVLRGNRKGVGMFKKSFGPSDPRLLIALETCEPLIHFALNCGAKSCPPIKTFSAKGVKAELKVAAEAFFESDDALLINEKDGEIGLTQILKWYSEDFGANKEQIIDFVKAHMGEGEKKAALSKVIKYGSYRVYYLNYDWGDNTKE